MKTLELEQGTPEWHEHRQTHFNASDASAMMGASPYKNRNELLKEYATGIRPEVSESQQYIFNKGHQAEAETRPFIESQIGEELYPVIGIYEGNPKLSASFDGLTMLGHIVWEHKLWSDEKAKDVLKSRIPAADYWQCVQQLVVSGAEKVIYTISDGSEEKVASTELHAATINTEALLAGWKQFEEDLKNFTQDAPEVEVVGRSPDALPALRIEVTGMVSSSNLNEFREHALSVFQGINTELQTDEDFANAEKTVKWCKDVEERLDAAKQHALSQTESIDELFRAIDSIKEEARQTRLNLERSVKARKESIRAEIQAAANDAKQAHVDHINETLGGKITLPPIVADFAGAMKGKKTVTSLRSACDDELARFKIEANRVADNIRINLETLKKDAEGFESLFHDAQVLVMKNNDDLQAVIKARIADHKEQEARRQEAEKAKAESESPAKVEPKPASVTETKAAPEPKTEAKPITRPTDDQIINAVADTFRVDKNTALGWIMGIQEDAAA